jgi:DNA invertase Pin-like site-specific DNA recombinase
MLQSTNDPTSIAAGEIEKLPPHAGKFVAYYRVSTKRQGASGLGLEAQRKVVDDFLNGGTWALVGTFTEKESGRRTDRHRPELRAALKLCEEEGATLVVAKLDRLTRNLPFLTRILESGQKFVCCDIPDMGNPAQTKFMLQLMANVAEYEAALISQRTKDALAAAKRRGVKLGTPSPKKGAKAGGEFVRQSADDLALEVGPILDELEKYGCITLDELAKGLEARGVKTARERIPDHKPRKRGKLTWSLSAVRNIRRRYRGLIE